MMTNSGAADLALNLIYSLKVRGIVEFGIWALDQKCFERLQRFDLPVEFASVACSDEYHAYGTAGFKQVVTHKFNLLLSQLTAGLDVLYLDVDTVVTGDIYSGLHENHDLLIQTSSPETPWEHMCTGLIYVRATPGARRFLDACNTVTKRDDMRCDQVAFNHVYKIRNELGLQDVRIEVLLPDLYQDGKAYFVRGGAARSPCVVHNNFVRGMAKKVRRFKRFGLWHLGRPDFEQVIRRNLP